MLDLELVKFMAILLRHCIEKPFTAGFEVEQTVAAKVESGPAVVPAGEASSKVAVDLQDRREGVVVINVHAGDEHLYGEPDAHDPGDELAREPRQALC